jgi:hypothetical protein
LIKSFDETEGLILLNAISKCSFLTNSFSFIGFLINSFNANSDASRTNADRSAPLEKEKNFRPHFRVNKKNSRKSFATFII